MQNGYRKLGGAKKSEVRCEGELILSLKALLNTYILIWSDENL